MCFNMIVFLVFKIFWNALIVKIFADKCDNCRWRYRGLNAQLYLVS